jgi:hypothetical protein
MALLACSLGLAGTILAATAETASGLTPRSPEVKVAIEKGMAFLESGAARDPGDRVGAYALQGYTLLLYGADPSHVKVAAAVQSIKKALDNRDPAKFNTSVWDVYSTGLAIIFLVKQDPKKNHDDIELLLAYLRTRQKPHGGWGYIEKVTGDTSMSQYGVLSSWAATQAGFDIPLQSIKSAAEWLMKTQDPSGGFGYQGNPATGNGLVAQMDVKPSMTAAGSGSLYICASLLGMIEKKEPDEKLPSALREIKAKEKGPAKERVKSSIDPRALRETQDRAAKWLQDHNKIDAALSWTNYYLYALERCMSFRELFLHKTEKEPQWYTDAAEYLMKTQEKDGSWSVGCGQVADTAFAVLFLMRSTQIVITKAKPYGEGTMIGGRGIPKDTRRIEIKGGSIVARPLLGPGQKLLDALDKPDGKDFDSSVELLSQLPTEEVEKLKAKYGGDTIRRLVSSKSAEVRLAAVLAIAKTRDLDNVEALIYALTDPDYRVVRAANAGLLRIRRVPVVVVLPESFSEEDRRLLVEKWRAWYQTIRPSAKVKY